MSSPKPVPVSTDEVSRVMALLGSRGGSSKSEAKARAARENGKRNVGKAKRGT